VGKDGNIILQKEQCRFQGSFPKAATKDGLNLPSTPLVSALNVTIICTQSNSRIHLTGRLL